MLSFDVKIKQLCYHQSISNINQYEKSKFVVLPSYIYSKNYIMNLITKYLIQYALQLNLIK